MVLVPRATADLPATRPADQIAPTSYRGPSVIRRATTGPASAPATEPATAPTTRPAPRVVFANDDAALVAAAKAGDEVTVDGVVVSADWSKTGRVMNVFLARQDGATPRDGSGVMVILFIAQREAFVAAFGGDVASQIRYGRIRVTGRLVPYGGYDEALKRNLQMVMTDPAQLEIIQPGSTAVEKGATTQPSTAPAPSTQP